MRLDRRSRRWFRLGVLLSVAALGTTAIAGCGHSDDGNDPALVLPENLVYDVGSHPVFAVGAVEGQPEEEFESIRAVAVWGDSLIGVFDSRAHEVRYFDLDARFLGRVGGRGQGPGELVSPLWTWVERDGRLGVFDEGQRRIKVYGPAGEFEDLHVPLDPEALPEPEPGTPPDLIWPRGRIGDAWFLSLVELSHFPPEGGTFQPRESFMVLRAGDLQGAVGRDVYSITWYTTRAGEHLRIPREVVPDHVASLNRELGAVLDPQNSRVFVIDRALEWREITLKERCPRVPDVFFEESEEGAERRGGIPLGEFREVVPACAGAYDRVAVTGDQRIWVRLAPDPSIDQEESESWKVIDAREGLLGIARLPRNFTPMDVASDVLYGRWIDEFGVHYLHGYELRR